MMQLMQLCQLYIHDANLLFHHLTRMILLKRDLMTVEAIIVWSTHSHHRLKKSCSDLFELCVMVHCVTESSNQKMVTLWSKRKLHS